MVGHGHADFSLGRYALFISDIDQAHGSRASRKILVIDTLDDLKSRLAKVILMILMVTLFERALQLKVAGSLDLLYFGGSIALVGLALYFTHAAESPRKRKEEALPAQRVSE